MEDIRTWIVMKNEPWHYQKDKTNSLGLQCQVSPGKKFVRPHLNRKKLSRCGRMVVCLSSQLELEA
jgi:hypothetical protein